MAVFWLREGTDARLFASLDGLAKQFHNWLAEQGEDHPAVKKLLDALEEPSAPSTIGRTYSSTTTGQQMSAMDHTSNDGQVCGRPPTKSRSETNSGLIYKWVDENGQTHMSDQQPEGRIASVVDLSMKKQDFTYEIIPDDVQLPLDFQGQLAAGSKRMYDTWHFFLGGGKAEAVQDSTLIDG